MHWLFKTIKDSQIRAHFDGIQAIYGIVKRPKQRTESAEALHRLSEIFVQNSADPNI